MSEQIYRALVLSVVKHDYLPNAVAAHPRLLLSGKLGRLRDSIRAYQPPDA